MVQLTTNVTFACGKGGSVTMMADADHLSQIGIGGGWAYWEDLHLNSPNDLRLNIGEGYTTSASQQHIIGTPVITFSVKSEDADPIFDVKVTGLQPNAYYEVLINGSQRRCETGWTRGETTDDGVLQFTAVEL